MPESKPFPDVDLGPWVYCFQHLAPHASGWCTVDVREKVGLGAFLGSFDTQYQAAIEKCRRLGLKLHEGTSSA